MSEGSMLVYRCAPDIEWVRDARQTVLVEAKAGRSWLLGGWKAAVWDLLSLGYLAEDIVRFLSVFLDVPPDAARRKLLMVLDEWECSGIVRRAAEDRRG